MSSAPTARRSSASVREAIAGIAGQGRRAGDDQPRGRLHPPDERGRRPGRTGANDSRACARQRIRAVLVKEFIQMRRDRLTFAMIIGMPIIQLDALRLRHQHRPEAPADRRSSSPTTGRSARAIVAGMQVSDYFDIDAAVHRGAGAREARRRRRSPSSSPCRADFHARPRARRATRRSRSRRTRPTRRRPPTPSPPCRRSCSRAVAEATHGALAAASAGRAPVEVVRAPASTIRKASPPTTSCPGLLGTILTMTTMLMTALALTREIERGTMENLLAMPVAAGRDHGRQDRALYRPRLPAGGASSSSPPSRSSPCRWRAR